MRRPFPPIMVFGLVLVVLLIAVLAFFLVEGRSGLPPIPADLQKLIAALEDPTPMVAAEAAEKLGAMGEAALPAAPALVKLLGSKNDFYYDGLDEHGRMTGGMISPRQEARAALLKIGPAAVPALIEGLGSADEETAGSSAELLGGFGDPRAIGPLRKIVVSKRAGVADIAAAALARLEGKK